MDHAGFAAMSDLFEKTTFVTQEMLKEKSLELPDDAIDHEREAEIVANRIQGLLI